MHDPGSGGRAFRAGLRLFVLAIVLTARASAAQSPCVGDCSGDGTVGINDLILGVNIALNFQPLDACPEFDASGTGRVEINELISAVNNALNGCP